MTTALAVLAAVEGSDIIVGVLIALIVAAIVAVAFHFFAPAYAAPAGFLTFLIILLLVFLSNGTFD